MASKWALPVSVSFTLDIDVDGWRDGRDVASSDIPSEVAKHAELVVRQLFDDMGWTV